MRKRTNAEIKAYAEGYSKCFRDFVESINTSNNLVVAINKMYQLMAAVNNAIPKEGENNDV